MRFPFSIYLLAFGVPFLVSLASLPWWRKWCLRHGLVDEPGPRKIHSEPVPLAGGLAVMTGLLLSLLGALLLVKLNLPEGAVAAKLAYGFGRRGLPLGAVVAGALAMLALGWLDDRHELRAGPKFLGQLLVAGLVAASGVRITLFVPSLLFSYAITVLWILTVTNAFNFQDNMNGLCTGLAVIAAGWLGLMAARHGQYLVASMAFLVGGAALGFLPHNFPRGRSFLGDAGSHLLGFLLGILAILPHFYSVRHPQPWAVLSPLLILAVPLGDLAWVVLLRWRFGRPFYVGDTNHLSHRLVRCGLSQAQAVLVIWGIAAGCGALAVLL
jgi:UDP-GlcNAc:undecaprenyl-phosphate/decaprenyl-phosphate GlcNAc-1-phosphate transferase